MEFIESVKVSEEEIENVNLRSNEVNEILGQAPKRIIRYGIGTISVILMVMFTFTFVFRYPDIIYGSFYIQSSNPPAFLLAKATGKIQSLHVTDKQAVTEGQLLATIENATSYASYQKLKAVLSDTVFEPIQIQELGELQSAYSNFQKSHSELKTFEALNYHQKKIKSLQRQKQELVRQITLQNNQLQASKVNTKLSEKMFERDSLLYQQQTIAAATFEKSKKDLVQQKMSFINKEISLSSSKNNLSGIEQQILELELNYQQETSRLQLAFENTLNQLKGAVDNWENTYCLKSPVAGKVSFSGIWEVNQNVRSGQHVVTVLPFEPSKILAKVSIPIARAGKVKSGQEVNLKLSDFPHREYGMLVAELHSISEVPDSFYTGTIVLNDSLVTNYGKNLQFKQNMQGVAEIITEDLSLAERLLFPLKEVFKNNF